MAKSSEVDDYIARAAEFARPILKRIRAAYHKASPEVQETMKWSFPHFEHKGVLGSMAAFKKHCSFGFWNGGIMKTVSAPRAGGTDMSYDKVTSLDELPSEKELVAMVKEAIELNEKGVKAPSRTSGKRGPAKPLGVPDDLAAALLESKAATKAWQGFSQSARNEYVDWIASAKQQATREKRLAQALEWIAASKPRNWKYMKEWK